jgi:hypothetical protein
LLPLLRTQIREPLHIVKHAQSNWNHEINPFQVTQAIGSSREGVLRGWRTPKSVKVAAESVINEITCYLKWTENHKISIYLLRSEKCFAQQPSKVFSNGSIDVTIVWIFVEHCPDEFPIHDVANCHQLLSLKLQREYMMLLKKYWLE